MRESGPISYEATPSAFFQPNKWGKGVSGYARLRQDLNNLDTNRIRVGGAIYAISSLDYMPEIAFVPLR